VAGGHSVGIGLMENVIKECAEEASVPAEIASKAQPVQPFLPSSPAVWKHI